MDKFPTVSELIEMAKSNPELLDELQKTENQKILDKQKDPINKKKLEGILFKMNMIKKKNKNNQMKTAIEISNMMHESKEKMVIEIRNKFGVKATKPEQPNLKIVKSDTKKDN